MAYDETTYRRQPDDSDDPATFRNNGFSPTEYRRRRDFDSGEFSTASLQRMSRAAADDQGRDRVGVHLGWEIVLLLAVAAVGYLLYRLDPATLRRPALDTLLISGTAIGLLTVGAGLTLRAGVPNLALGPIALASALHYAENGDQGLLDAALPAAGIAAAGGLVVALLVIGLHVPGWLATLSAGLGVVVLDQMRAAPVAVQGAYDPSDQAFYLFGGFAVLAVVGGALASATPVRRLLGRMRPVGDPADRRGALAALPVIGTLVISSVFAVGAGILMAAQSAEPIRPGTGLEWSGIAIGTALVAGTSAYGRRGGIFGTLLAVAGLALFLDYSERRDFDIALFAVGAALIGVGLAVTRLVETYGRPLEPGPSEEEWTGSAPAGGTNTWSPDLPETWSPSPSAQNRSERWDDGPWGTSR